MKKYIRVCRYTLTSFAISLLCNGALLPKLATAVDIHVATSGSDDADGSRQKPFATLHRAQAEARKHSGRQPITVWLHKGTHYLERPLRFEAADSGTKDNPVTYRAVGDDTVISGGQVLSLNWAPYQDGIWQAAIPRGLNIDQLFINETRQPMARYPNFDPNIRHFNGFAADAFSKERAAKWKSPSGGYIHAMHRAHWGGYHYRITGKNDKGEVTYEGGWQNNRQMGMHDQHRFVENVFEELDAAGEWFHDAKQNKLFYKPEEGVDPSTALVEIARLAHLVEFIGSEKQPVRFVNLSGLVFRHAARTFMKNREPLLRSDWTTYRGGAVLFRGAESCRVIECEFDQVGGNAVFVNNYNRNIRLTGCHIHDAGGNGVCFVGNPDAVRNPLFNYSERNSYQEIDKTPGPKSNDYPSKCIVEDCLIERTGRVEKQTAGVQISMASHITVRHCSIYEVPRAGINISEGTFGGHLIEFCDVFDTVLETGDHGSFNSWGRDRFWGLKDAPTEELPALAKLDMVARNTIRNSRWRCDHGWDIDLDDGSSNYDVYNNLMLMGGLKFREGFNRVAENNIMVGNSFHPHVWYANSGDVFKNNIVFTEYKPIRVPTPWGETVDKNLLHQSGTDVAPAAELAKQSGRDENSVIGDALFVDPANGDFRVKEGSPASALGFKSFPMDRFGVQSPSLKEIAKTPAIPGSEAFQKPESPASLAGIDSYWLGAKLHELKDDEFSAYGVSKEDNGIVLVEIPAESAAALAGLRKNDVLQKLNDHRIPKLESFYQALATVGDEALEVTIVRNQKREVLMISKAPFVVIESSETAQAFSSLRLPRTSAGRVTANRKTANDPIATLVDGKLAKGYGPVFGNGIQNGAYKMDLGGARQIEAINSWSYKQANRGAQRVTLYGSESTTDPGWNLADRKRFRPLGSIDTTGVTVGVYNAVSLRAREKSSLGTFRWIIWRVSPISELAENTAFQELAVEIADKNAE